MPFFIYCCRPDAGGKCPFPRGKETGPALPRPWGASPADALGHHPDPGGLGPFVPFLKAELHRLALGEVLKSPVFQGIGMEIDLGAVGGFQEAKVLLGHQFEDFSPLDVLLMDLHLPPASAQVLPELQIQGVGYSFRLAENNAVGFKGVFSFDRPFPLPASVKAELSEKDTVLTLRSIDKQVLGRVAKDIRGLAPADRYKGKGVRFLGEQITLKARKGAK